MTQADHIVIINDTSMPTGGAGLLAVALALRLAKKGRRVTFFAGDDGINPEFERAGINVVSVGGKPLLESRSAGFVNGVHYAKAKKILAEWIRANDTANTAYHVHAWSQILSPSIFIALRAVAARTAITAHDFFLVCPNGNFTIYPKSKPCALQPMSLSCALCNCDKRSYPQKVWRLARQVSVNRATDLSAAPFTVLAIHAGMIPYLTRGGVPETCVKVMPNPADRMRDSRVQAEINHEVVFLGRLDREKGGDIAAAAARDAGLSIRIIGDGPERHEIARINPDSIFEGWRQNEEIAGLLNHARLLVMPSRCMEPFGLSAAEALKAGVPVIASETALIGADLERFGMGRRVNVFDQGALATMLRAFAATDEAVKSMSEAAFKNADEIALPYEAWTRGHLDIYDRFVVDATG